MRKAALIMLSGTLFGAGLALSGMMDPARVRGFLDIFGGWDPTLGFVMAGAIAVMGIAWWVQRRMSAPIANATFHLPDTQRIDGRLILGAALFGAGWGLAGLCPGPAIASLITNIVPAAPFVAAMLAGMALFPLIERCKGAS
jgi:hypothetical protein|tara:strand:- start:33351 stop:33776 length:426 start_codon:yes stop_codon:yes gene_type:complete